MRTFPKNNNNDNSGDDGDDNTKPKPLAAVICMFMVIESHINKCKCYLKDVFCWLDMESHTAMDFTVLLSSSCLHGILSSSLWGQTKADKDSSHPKLSVHRERWCFLLFSAFPMFPFLAYFHCFFIDIQYLSPYNKQIYSILSLVLTLFCVVFSY